MANYLEGEQNRFGLFTKSASQEISDDPEDLTPRYSFRNLETRSATKQGRGFPEHVSPGS